MARPQPDQGSNDAKMRPSADDRADSPTGKGTGADQVKSASRKISEQPIGRILVEAGRLSATDVQRIAQFAAEFKLRFGDAAVQMDLIKRSDVNYALGRQFSFWHLDRNDPALSPDLIAAYQPDHPTVERLRGLRAKIETRASTGGRKHPIVGIVSSDRGDGRSFIAANLAVVFAQMGRRTLVIDADMRNPTQHHYFRCDNHLGLSSLLAGRCGVECLHRIGAFPQIFVLTAGPAPPNPLELLERPIFAQLLASADINFKAVIIDTPADVLGADAQLIGHSAGANLLITRCGNTRASNCERLIQSLQADETNVLGIVLNEQ